MRIVVTGGLGSVGSRVVARLREDGHDVTSASRRSGVDLAEGTGIDAAIAGVDAVVHTADTKSPTKFGAVTVGGTRHLMEAVSRADRPPHVVYISIVGIDDSPYAYYRAKLEAEREIARADGPATVLRATQFHTLAKAIGRWTALGPVALGIRGAEVQSVDIDAVADRLAAIATGPAPSVTARATDVAGPERLTMAQVAALVAGHRGKSMPRLVNLPTIGGTMTSFARGDNLPGADADIIGSSFTDWLEQQPTT